MTNNDYFLHVHMNGSSLPTMQNTQKAIQRFSNLAITMTTTSSLHDYRMQLATLD